MFDTPVDYETLAQLGSIMGSGGMVVMDEDNCMVDVARYFVEFTHSESCGKCVPCRAGLDQALTILNKFTTGHATEGDLATLDELSRMIRDMLAVRPGPNRAQPGADHAAPLPQRVRGPPARPPLPRRRVRGTGAQPCENSCPLHMNIPRFLEFTRKTSWRTLSLSVILDNPLPASTGRVCQHPCDNRCRRVGIDAAVNMRDVHRFIADSAFADDHFYDAAMRACWHAASRPRAKRRRGRRGTDRSFLRLLPGSAGP